MSVSRWIITGVLAVLIAAGLTLYISLVADGTLPPPNIRELMDRFALGTATAAQLGFVIFIGVVVFMAMVAPVIYAARSHDLLTLLISFAMTGTAIAVFLSGKTAFQEITALIIYLANIVLSSIVYAAHRIAPRT
jgi:sterol desaturase/sphingolipid hydroxylase (fatty acid hydroxylase superfamily)